MRVEVDQLNNEIKTAGQTIRIKFAKRDLKEVSSIDQMFYLCDPLGLSKAAEQRKCCT